MKLGIAQKVTLLLTVTILALGSFLGVYINRHESAVLHRSLDERARALVDNLAASLRYPLAVGDHEAIGRLLEAVMAQPEVAVVRVASDRDSTLFELRDSTQAGSRNAYRAAISVRHELPAGGEEQLLLGEVRTVTEVIGVVHLEVSLRGLHARIGRLGTTTLAVVVGATLLAALVCLLLMRPILGTPIRLLSEATRRIARGELESTVVVTSDDEMGMLASAFNAMTAELRNSMVSRDYVDKILDSMNDALVVADPQGSITRTNRAAEQLLGWRSGELVGRQLTSLFADPGIAGSDWLATFVRAGGVLSSTETSLLTAAGERIPVLLSGAVMTGAGGQPQAVVCVALDIRELKRAEEEIRALSSAVQQAVEGVGLADLGGAITYANDALAAMHQRPAGELIGTGLSSLRAEPQRPEWEQVVSRVRDGQAWTGELTGLRRDGATFPAALSLTLLRDGEGRGRGLLLHSSDITGRKELEMQLLQAQKLDSIGQLAGGVAHDFNNMLGAISGYADMIRQRFGPGNPTLEKYAGRILEASRRSAELTAKLLAFARKGKFEMAVVNIHAVVQDVVGLLEHTIDRRISIVLVLNARPPTVMGDRTQLQNAVLNLAVNARDAMPEGGRMTFATEVVGAEALPTGERSVRGATGSFLRLSVTDTGIGMDEQVRSRIFEPFFTTKELGKGTGLGLASVYGTLRSHGGAIDVVSSPAKGSSFTIYLPVVAEPTGESAGAAAGVPRGSGTVLLVDDEEIIRAMASEMLGELGYTVRTCGNGAEAVAYYREHGATVDLVVLDMVMPTMGGYDCFTALLGMNPNVRALVCSGYTVNDEVRRIMDAGVLGFVHKPFDVKELGRAVAQALASR